MHLLFLSSLLPEEAPRSGFEIANAAILDAYRRQGVHVTSAGFRRPGGPDARDGEILLGRIPIENAGASALQKAAWVANAFARGLTVSSAKLAGLGGSDLRALLEGAGRVDGLVLSSVQMPIAYPFLTSWKPSILVAHNVEHRSARENAARARGRLSRILFAREARLLEAAETRLCREAVVVHTLSRQDKTGLGLGSSPACLPLALSIGRAFRPDDGTRAHDVGLIGTWSWAPNRVGLDWFLEDVAPRLSPGTTVAIAGRFDGPTPRTSSNVRFLGSVPDAQAFVRASRVIALATRGGTGVQLKTIETFEEGMPAVATRSALRGVDALPSNVRVCDDPQAFAAALEELAAEDRTGETLRTDGAAFARSQREALDRAILAGLQAFRNATRLVVPAAPPLVDVSPPAPLAARSMEKASLR